MATIKTQYLGSLRNQATHLKSGNQIITDAPVDNNGKGEMFSPTDLLCTALGTCMQTIMGIAAQKHNFDLGQPELEITKHMASNPRRVDKIELRFDFKGQSFSAKEQKILQKAALDCPVALSLHPEIEQSVEFNWQ